MNCPCIDIDHYVDFRYEIRDQHGHFEDELGANKLSDLCSIFTIMHYFCPELLNNICSQNRATHRTVLNRVNSTGIWISAKNARHVTRWAEEGHPVSRARIMRASPQIFRPITRNVTYCSNSHIGHECISYAKHGTQMVKRWKNRGTVWVYGWRRMGGNGYVDIPGFQPK